MSISETICRHQHPLEWAARAPRTSPCRPCVELAGVVEAQRIRVGMMTIERSVPAPVVVVCGNCGGPGGRNQMRVRR